MITPRKPTFDPATGIYTYSAAVTDDMLHMNPRVPTVYDFLLVVDSDTQGVKMDKPDPNKPRTPPTDIVVNSETGPIIQEANAWLNKIRQHHAKVDPNVQRTQHRPESRRGPGEPA